MQCEVNGGRVRAGRARECPSDSEAVTSSLHSLNARDTLRPTILTRDFGGIWRVGYAS